MSDAIDELQRKLKALEGVFLDRLPEKITEITDALHLFQQDRGRRDALNNLHRHLHTMAGSAGTFGFAELGIQARAFESRLKSWLNQDSIDEAELEQFVTDVDHYFSSAIDVLAHNPEKLQSLTSQLSNETMASKDSGSRLVYFFGPPDSEQDKLNAQLEHFGYEVVEIRQFKDLPIAVGTRRPDLLLIELRSNPDAETGADDLRKIQQLARLKIPTIFVARSNSFETRMQAVRAQGHGFFTRPVDVVALTEKMEMLLNAADNREYRILIVDDDEVTANFYGAVLRNAGMNVRFLSDPTQILAVMADFRPELLLLDVYMPQCNGVELAQLIRQDNSYVDIPIVFFSSESDENKQIDAVRSGADDFITKPVSPNYLVAAIANRADRYRSLRSLIMRDGLTGLLNHTAIKEQLSAEILKSIRHESDLSLAMIDLDNFKKINDSYGHAVGDQVLRTLSRLLRQRLRRTDIVGRYGGEEFAVIFPETNASTARHVLEQIRLAFQKIRHHADQAEFSVSFSGGIADIRGISSADALFDLADAAMYLSKQRGRNQITLA